MKKKNFCLLYADNLKINYYFFYNYKYDISLIRY